MSWQNWVVSWKVRRQIKRPTEREPFDPVATRIGAEKRKMPSPVELPSDWRIVPARSGLTGEWIEPADLDMLDDPPPVVLYLHGGGYFFCSPRTHRPITIGLATHARSRVHVPDYRLAPEHPFPAAIEDALASYRTLLAHGVSPAQIVVAGDSAGGGLALALLVALRDAGDPLPAGAILYSPWTDLAATGQSLIDNDESDVMFRGAWMAYGATIYLGGHAGGSSAGVAAVCRLHRFAATALLREHQRGAARRHSPNGRACAGGRGIRFGRNGPPASARVADLLSFSSRGAHCAQTIG